MSILLEGKVSQTPLAQGEEVSSFGSSDGTVNKEAVCGWTGNWSFFKDNRASYEFRFARVGDNVPKDLVRYVSFYVEHDKSGALLPRKRGRAKGWRKYSGIGSSQGTGGSALQRTDSSLSSNESIVGVPCDGSGDIADSAGSAVLDNALYEESEHEAGDHFDAASGGEDHGHEEVGEDEGERDSEGGGHGTTGGDDETGRRVTFADEAEVNELSALDDKEAGSDSCAPSTTPPSSSTSGERGTDSVHINRTHLLFGLWEGSFDIKGLDGPHPVPETFFFHTLANADELPEGFKSVPPTDWWTSAQLLKHANVDALELFDEIFRNGNAVTGISKSPVSPASSRTGIEVPDLCATDSTADATSTSSSAADGGASELTGSASQTKATVVDSARTSNMDYLIGFGRNSYGRFSLFGIYNRATGVLSCERKYLISRSSGMRKSQKSAAAQHAMQTSTPSDVRTSGRAHRSPSHAYLDESFTSSHKSAGASSKSKLKEPPSAGSLAYGAGDAGSDAAGSGLKRKRSSSGAAEGGSSSGRPKSSSELERLMDVFNDYTDHTFRYRPVYYDEVTGQYYEGFWASGCRNGKGLCVYPDKTMYDGDWYMDKEHGKGVLMTFDRQEIFRGEWVDGMIHGFGTYSFPNGDVYRGDWREGNRHGKGEYFVFEYGCTYTGDWKDNKRHGKGTFTWADGSKYEGDWENDCRHGRGMLQLANGFYYDGYWHQNAFDGRGHVIFPNGQDYQGMFKHGMREGRGSVAFSEGAVYEGRFREDKMDGQGTCKISKVLQGVNEEWMIPIEIQADFRRIHFKAGFWDDAH